MALTCITGGRECTGCGACRKIDEEKVLYNCIACGDKIYEGDIIVLYGLKRKIGGKTNDKQSN